jgi:serine/threonine protein kinase
MLDRDDKPAGAETVEIPGLPESIRVRYEVDRRLPDGTFGPAWRLTDSLSGAHVVLRRLASGQAASNRFSTDLRTTADALGPSQFVVSVLDVLDGAGCAWLLRDWIEGENLAEALRTLSVLSQEQTRTLIGSVCRGLIGHDRKPVVHGNLHPNNILIDMSGRVMVGDHGFRGAGAVMTDNKDIHYFAPEVVAGGVPTAQSDVYALGALLYASLCGIYPLPLGANGAANTTILAAHNIAPPPRGARLAGGLGNVVWRSFQLKPEDRYPTVEHFLDALSRTKSGEPVSLFSRLQSGLIGD